MRCFYTLVLVLAFVSTHAQLKLSVIGSSTSACTGPTSYANCYLGRLENYYPGLTIYNLAIGGYNVYKGMPSSFTPEPGFTIFPDPDHNITKAVDLNPNTIIVNYPTNNFDTMSIARALYAFRVIRDSANKEGKTAYITTTQPRTGFSLAGRAKLKELRDSILLQHGYFAINFWDGLADATGAILPAYDAGDGIHLNDAGHAILFQRVRDKNIFSVALPAKLKWFNAKAVNDKVDISWAVLDEVAGVNYELQRSIDGTNFQTIQSFTSAAARSTANYDAVDAKPGSAIVYYRLQISEGAKSYFSAIAKVQLRSNKVSLKSLVAGRQQLAVTLGSDALRRVELHIINSVGMRVQQTIHQLQPGDNSLKVSLSNISAGTYWIECISNGEKIFTKGLRIN